MTESEEQRIARVARETASKDAYSLSLTQAYLAQQEQENAERERRISARIAESSRQAEEARKKREALLAQREKEMTAAREQLYNDMLEPEKQRRLLEWRAEGKSEASFNAAWPSIRALLLDPETRLERDKAALRRSALYDAF